MFPGSAWRVAFWEQRITLNSCCGVVDNPTVSIAVKLTNFAQCGLIRTQICYSGTKLRYQHPGPLLWSMTFDPVLIASS